jgi:hypothetical protein
MSIDERQGQETSQEVDQREDEGSLQPAPAGERWLPLAIIASMIVTTAGVFTGFVPLVVVGMLAAVVASLAA